MTMAPRIASTVMTTSNSIRVKPCSLLRCRRAARLYRSSIIGCSKISTGLRRSTGYGFQSAPHRYRRTEPWDALALGSAAEREVDDRVRRACVAVRLEPHSSQQAPLPAVEGADDVVGVIRAAGSHRPGEVENVGWATLDSQRGDDHAALHTQPCATHAVARDARGAAGDVDGPVERTAAPAHVEDV